MQSNSEERRPEQVGEPCICRLSYVLESLADVRQVRLANNKLTSLPPAIWKLRQLTHLDLSNNRLDSIPDDIAGLANLQVSYSFPGNRKIYPKKNLPSGAH